MPAAASPPAFGFRFVFPKCCAKRQRFLCPVTETSLPIVCHLRFAISPRQPLAQHPKGLVPLCASPSLRLCVETGNVMADGLRIRLWLRQVRSSGFSRYRPPFRRWIDRQIRSFTLPEALRSKRASVQGAISHCIANPYNDDCGLNGRATELGSRGYVVRQTSDLSSLSSISYPRTNRSAPKSRQLAV